MTKKVLDTNIYIDLFADTALYTEIFISEGPIYLSSIVFMELLAGAHTKNEKREIQNFINLFRKLGRILIPTVKDYEQAGEILARLQNIKGYDIKKSASITNDCLIAASVRNIGGLLYTQNKKDFQAIQEVFDFKVTFV